MRSKAAPEKTRRSARAALLAILLGLLGFGLGRLSGGSSDPAPPVGGPPAAPSPALSCTSTSALCPCPAPRAAGRHRRLARRSVAPVLAALGPLRDASAGTAAYLRAHATAFAPCAPMTGGSLRVHLELSIAPDGVIEDVRIANLEPLPPAVATCVEALAAELDPPGFDAAEAELFAITLVL